MDLSAVEAILRNKPKSLRLFRTKIERSHEIEERTCKRCGTVHTLVIKRCKDRLCKHCAGRGYRPLCRTFESLSVLPSHLIHLVLPYRNIPLQELRTKHVTELKKAIERIRRQAWFKRVISGGFYFVELDINKKWEARLHAHVLVESYKTAHSNPIDIGKASRAWYRLTGQSLEGPNRLKKNTRKDAYNRFTYCIKQMRGEPRIKILKDLEKYINMQTEKSHSTMDSADRKTQAKDIQAAQRCRVFIIEQFNRVFAGKQRRAFFGSWRGKKPERPTGKPQYRCHCGSKAYPEPIPRSA